MLISAIQGQDKRVKWWNLNRYAREDLVLSGMLHESDFAMSEAIDWFVEQKADVYAKKQRKIEDK